MSSHSSVHKNPSEVVFSLDLHGQTKDQAIRSMTKCFERQLTLQSNGDEGHFNANANDRKAVYVEVITGTGSHGSNGPVLREAIRSVLISREMSFEQLNAGSFKVNIASGFELYPDGPATDSKITSVAQNSEFARASLANHTRSAVPYANRASSRSYRRMASDNSSGYNGDCERSCGSNLDFELTPAEAKQFDVILRTTQSASRREFEFEKSQKYEEERILDQVLIESELYSPDKEEEFFRKALTESRLEAEKEEKELQQAIKESEACQHSSCKDDEDFMKAVQASIALHEAESDDELDRAIEESKKIGQETHIYEQEFEADLNKALKVSSHVVSRDEEEEVILQEVMRRSLEEA